MLKSYNLIESITRIISKKHTNLLFKKHSLVSSIGSHNQGFSFRTVLTRVSVSPNIMIDNGLDLTLLRILDNEDPFTDSETKDISTQTCRNQRSQLIMLLPQNEMSCSTPKSQLIPPNNGEPLSQTFESSDIDEEFMAAIEAMEAEKDSCRKRFTLTLRKNTTIATTTTTRSRRRSSSSGNNTRQNTLSGTPTTKRHKTCTYIQTSSQFVTPLIQESDTGIEIVNPTVDHCLSSSPPATISQVRNPFRIPTQFQRAYSTSVKQQKNDNQGQIPHHTIVLATQHGSIKEGKETQQKQLEIDAKNVKPIILSNEQEYVLKQVMLGVSLFFTGPAGTGKSVLLRSIIKTLRAKRSRGIAVTASTGLAACNIGGITLHSFAGIGLGQGTVDTLYKKVRRNRTAFKRWQETKVLVIDEISMVDGHLLDKMNELAKKIRKSNAPFGGIQLVACGDFYQLPPVVKSESEEIYFAFECESWAETIKQTISLKEVFRQKGDSTFINMLNEMRAGLINDESTQKFHQLQRPLQCPEGFVPSELYATRYEVERANTRKLAAIDSEEVVYKAKDSGTLPKNVLEMILANYLAPQKLVLKVGAQVICLKNFDQSLVNGSLGKVVGFVERSNLSDGESVFEQFEIVGGTTNGGERKKRHTTNMKQDASFQKLPVIKFIGADTVSRTVVVDAESWSTEDTELGNIVAQRTQLPLSLSWALSIHKAQGQSLPYVVVDFKKIFEAGQGYVALSRAISRDGLRILNFNPRKIRAHPKVIKFYKKLSSVQAE